jgi:hypothetical protein
MDGWVDIHVVDITTLEAIRTLFLLGGMAVTLVGLWFSSAGLRVVVSGRIDERRRSGVSLKRGLIVLLVGVLLLLGSFMLTGQ